MTGFDPYRSGGGPMALACMVLGLAIGAVVYVPGAVIEELRMRLRRAS